jgi:hypothetical protein
VARSLKILGQEQQDAAEIAPAGHPARSSPTATELIVYGGKHPAHGMFLDVDYGNQEAQTMATTASTGRPFRGLLRGGISAIH